VEVPAYKQQGYYPQILKGGVSAIKQQGQQVSRDQSGKVDKFRIPSSKVGKFKNPSSKVDNFEIQGSKSNIL